MLKSILIIIFLLMFAFQNEMGKVEFKINEQDIFPEGITYSKVTNSFYLSSIKKTKIIRIDANNGKFTDFISANVFGLGVLGLAVDDKRKILWACANKTIKGKRVSVVFKIDLISGTLLKTFQNKNSEFSTFNDLAINSKGDVYFTDTAGDQIYFIYSKIDSMSLYYKGDEIKQPNGITISPDDKYLYIASHNNGIRVLDLETRTLFSNLNEPINSKGIDGLKFFNNSLVGVQNTFERDNPKIIQYYLNKSGTAIVSERIIDEDNPHFNIPTTCAINGSELFCIANSQLNNINFSDYSIKDSSSLKNIIILKYNL